MKRPGNVSWGTALVAGLTEWGEKVLQQAARLEARSQTTEQCEENLKGSGLEVLLDCKPRVVQ